jgi:hypothetical protein
MIQGHPTRDERRERGTGETSALFSLLTWLALGLGALLTGIWLWSCWCSFPGIPWNDIRVAPAVGLSRGISIYGTEGVGPVNTWIYGPAPLIVLLPAGLASTAAGAVMIAGAIHVALTAMGLAFVMYRWPVSVPSVGMQNWQLRTLTALLCVLLFRNENAGYIVYTADTPGIIFGLLSLLALSRGYYWAAAAGAAAATACKQTFLGLGVAEIVWLYFAVSPRAASLHLVRCVVAGGLVAAIAVAYFGVAGLWHTMVALPSSFPWAAPVSRIREHELHLALHVLLPLVGVIVFRRLVFSRHSPLLLPALALVCTLPFGLVGFFKIGGNVNSLYSFWLWFPPTLAVLATHEKMRHLGQKGILGLALIAASIASLWLRWSNVRVIPNIQAYREATYLAVRMPQRIWFPMHPIVTLYSDGRFYHDLDGIRERAIGGIPMSDDHFFSHLPRTREATATLLPVGWGLADISDGRLPPDLPVRTFGLWRIDGELRLNP